MVAAGDRFEIREPTPDPQRFILRWPKVVEVTSIGTLWRDTGTGKAGDAIAVLRLVRGAGPPTFWELLADLERFYDPAVTP